MAYAARWRRVRVAIPLLLLTTILMRLVWMQLRSYPIEGDARVIIAREEIATDGHDTCRTSERAKAIPRSTVTAGKMPERLIRAWLISPGLVWFTDMKCRNGMLSDHDALRINQGLLIGTVLLAALMSRFLTSSWTVALIVAGMLMSRGGLLAHLGRVSADWLLTFCLTLWMTCLTHYLRSGSLAAMCGAVFAVIFGSLFDRALIALSLSMPVVLLFGFFVRRQLTGPLIHRMRQVNRRWRALSPTTAATPDMETESFLGRVSGSVRFMLGMEFPSRAATGSISSFQRGTLFKTLDVPFPLWVYRHRRWLRLASVWLLVFATTVGLSVLGFAVILHPAGAVLPELQKLRSMLQAGGLPNHFPDLWTLLALERIDLHLAMSLLVIVVCAWQSPAAGLSGFLEAIWLVLVGFVLIAAAVFILDTLDARLIERLPFQGRRALWTLAFGPREFMLWWEPVLLSLGVAGIYNLMKVFDSRFAEKN